MRGRYFLPPLEVFTRWSHLTLTLLLPSFVLHLRMQHPKCSRVPGRLVCVLALCARRRARDPSLLCPTLCTHTAPIRRIRPSSSAAFVVSSRPAQHVCLYVCVCVHGEWAVYVSSHEAPAGGVLVGTPPVPWRGEPCATKPCSRKKARQKKRGRWGRTGRESGAGEGGTKTPMAHGESCLEVSWSVRCVHLVCPILSSHTYVKSLN